MATEPKSPHPLLIFSLLGLVGSLAAPLSMVYCSASLLTVSMSVSSVSSVSVSVSSVSCVCAYVCVHFCVFCLRLCLCELFFEQQAPFPANVSQEDEPSTFSTD